MLLKNENISLRPLSRFDLPIIQQALSDSNLSLRYLPATWRLYSIEQLELLLKDWHNQTDSYVYIIESLSLKQSVGMVNVDSLDVSQGHSELGITLFSERYKGQGFSKEALMLVLEYLFKTLRLNRVFVRILSKNEASIRFFQKNSFVLEGRMREHIFRNGQFEDMLIYSLLANEYEEMVKNNEKK